MNFTPTVLTVDPKVIGPSNERQLQDMKKTLTGNNIFTKNKKRLAAGIKSSGKGTSAASLLYPLGYSIPQEAGAAGQRDGGVTSVPHLF